MVGLKNIARYKLIAAILIKYTIEEYSPLSVQEIAEMIIDRKKRNTEEDVLAQTIDLEPTESGDRDNKGIRHDLVFLIRETRQRKRLVNKVTINFEVQSSKKSYNMVSRAVYYTAHLLKNTIRRGDNYDKLHKVYSIWFCDFTLNDEIEMYEEIKNRPIHHYRMGRHYTDINKASIDDAGDLMEAVMVELEKMKTLDKAEYKMLKTLFYDTKNSMSLIEEVTKINLTKYKEVVDMFDIAEELRKEKERAKTELTRSVVSNLKSNLSKNDAINNISLALNIDKVEAQRLYDEA